VLVASPELTNVLLIGEKPLNIAESKSPTVSV
jgi:hypothetical protein